MATGERISKRLVDSLRGGEREVTVWDRDLPGFGVRVRTTGVKTYICQYRAGSGRGAPTRKVTLGAVGKLTPDEARASAKRLLGAVAQGGDPVSDRRAARDAILLRELADRFMTEHVLPKRKPNTAEQYKHVIDAHIRPALGAKRAISVAKSDVAKLHHDLRDRPAIANRTLAVVGSMYGWAEKAGLIEENVNPATGIEKYPENRRERFLGGEELERLGAAIRLAETTGIPWQLDPGKKTKHTAKPEHRFTVVSPFAAAALRLLLFTGARLREILHLRWAEVDLERGLLFLPDSKTGRKTIVLSSAAMDVLRGLDRAGEYVIAGDDPAKPRADLKRPWVLVTRHAGLEGVRLHDLRHSFASVGAGGGLGLPIIGKLLGHSQASTTQRYAHLDADPLRRASDAIAGAIASSMGEPSPHSKARSRS